METPSKCPHCGQESYYSNDGCPICCEAAQTLFEQQAQIAALKAERDKWREGWDVLENGSVFSGCDDWDAQEIHEAIYEHRVESCGLSLTEPEESE